VRRRRRLPGLFAAAALCAPASAYAATPIHYTSAGITPGSNPAAITPGPGGVWFTEPGGNRVARIDETGAVTEFSAGIHGTPSDITAGADGNVWFAEASEGRMARITPQGTVTEFSAGITGFPGHIATGSDGNVWFSEFGAGKIAKIRPDGTVTAYDDAGGGAPDLIAPGPDGMWFAASGVLGAIAADGEVSDSSFSYAPEFAEGLAPGPGGDMAFSVSDPDAGQDPPNHVLLFSDLDTLEASIPLSEQAITMARDAGGDLWVPEFDDRIMRISPDGSHSEFRSDAGLAEPIVDIAAGPDGRMWVTQSGRNRIGVFDPKVALPPPDTTGPAISVTAPAPGAHYAQGARVDIGFSCADGESGVTFCQADSRDAEVTAPSSCADWPVLSRIPHASLLFLERPGDALDTAQPGAHRFTVATIDAAGETSCVTRTYVVDPPAPDQPDRATLRARLRRVGGAITRALKRGGERRLARRHVIGLKVHWPSAGRLTLVVRRAHGMASVAHGSRRLTRAKAARLALHTTKRGRKAARTARRHHHRLGLTLGLRFHVSGGATLTRRAKVTLKR
jgi:virginiamycin B lyase